jgi:hypothetical protein
MLVLSHLLRLRFLDDDLSQVLIDFHDRQQVLEIDKGFREGPGRALREEKVQCGVHFLRLQNSNS